MSKNKKSKRNSIPNKQNHLVSILQKADAAYNQNNFEVADQLYAKALSINTNLSLVHYNRGLIKFRNNNFLGAIENFTEACKLEPENATFLLNLGGAYDKARNFQKAEYFYRQALEKNNKLTAAYNNLSNILIIQKRYDDAIFLLNVAIKINPENDKSYNNLGTIYNELERYDLAIENFKKSIELNPNNYRAYANLGNALRVIGYYDMAAECIVRALHIKPDFYDIYDNYSSILKLQGKYSAALEASNIAIQHNPSNPTFKWNRSFINLLLGNLEAGWDDYEYGKVIRKRTAFSFGLPEWNGEDLTGSNIIVGREQGVGDDILFSNCIEDLVQLAKKVTITCDKRLVSLLSRSFPECNVIPVIYKKEHLTVDKEKIQTSNQYEVSMGSLPKFFRKSIHDFPDKKSYLTPDANRTAYWKDKLNGINNDLKIGLAWRSGLVNAERSLYYLSLDDLKPLFQLENIQFINMQYDITEDEIKFINEHCKNDIVDFKEIDLFEEIDDSASLTNALDLMIGVGTTPSALSGAIGQETIMLQHPHVWDLLGTNYYPWQPSAKVFIQSEPPSWEKEIQNICDLINSKFIKTT